MYLFSQEQSNYDHSNLAKLLSANDASFTPQAERFLDVIQPSRLNSVAFRYTFSVEAMTKISYIIEDTVIGNPRVADTHVSFHIFLVCGYSPNQLLSQYRFGGQDCGCMANHVPVTSLGSSLHIRPPR